MMAYNNITVAGGGTIGSQIAYMCAFHGKNTTIWGFDDKSVELAKNFTKQWAKAVQDYTHCSDDKIKNAANHLSYNTDLKAATHDADLMIEAVPEDLKIKRGFYENFSKVNDNPHMDLATNTSSMLPSMMADATDCPNRFLACMFANHIWANNTAEIMPHPGTDKDMPGKMAQFAREIGMLPIILKKEQSGMLSNALVIPFLEAGASLWVNGVADPQTIDKAWMASCGAPTGPFAMLDMFGIRTPYDIAKMRADKDPEMAKIAAAFKKMIDAGKTGRESGEGFYKYPNPAFEDPNFLKA